MINHDCPKTHPDWIRQIHPNSTAHEAIGEVIDAKTGNLANRFGLKLAEPLFHKLDWRSIGCLKPTEAIDQRQQPN